MLTTMVLLSLSVLAACILYGISYIQHKVDTN